MTRARRGRPGAVVLPRVALRPQAVLLALFGDYLTRVGLTVSSASVVDLLAAAGVGEHAARATLNRMVKRGLLHRRTLGRRAYFGLTDFGARTVADGAHRTHQPDVADHDWDGTWTFVAYSLPEEAQRERHQLRARLVWAGFGMVQAGLWAAPRRVTVADITADFVADVTADLADVPAVTARVTAFAGVPLPPTSGADLVAQAYPLPALRAAYRGFRQRWAPVADADPADLVDPLVARMVLTTDWLQVIRDDPRLPEVFLEPDWPGTQARALYVALDATLRPAAEQHAQQRLELGPDDRRG